MLVIITDGMDNGADPPFLSTDPSAQVPVLTSLEFYVVIQESRLGGGFLVYYFTMYDLYKAMMTKSFHLIDGVIKSLDRLVQVFQLVFDPNQQIYGNRNGKTHVGDHAEQLLHYHFLLSRTGFRSTMR